MTVRNVRKNLAGQQDLLPGVGPYIQTRRGVSVTVDGPAKSYIELWNRSLYEANLAYVGTFEDGCTASNGECVVSLKLGRAFKWQGPLDNVVPMNSSPSSTGGIGPTAWVDIALSSLKANLDSDSGFANIKYKPSGVAGAVKRSLEDWLEDGLIADVKWFGAKGDWDPGIAQTGTDDTAAVNSALLFLATLGSRRVGAVRKLHFPTGNYRLDYIDVPLGIGFALSTTGVGRYASQLFFNPANTAPAFNSVIEAIDFNGLGIFGSLSDTAAIAGPSGWKDVCFKGKNYFDTADIDVQFKDCNMLFFKEVAQVYGRGATFDNCGVGEINCLLNIVCDESTTFTPGNALGSVETGMRNYVIRNCRADQVRVALVRVTGTGPQKDYINGLAIKNNDLVAVVKLVDATSATLRRLSIVANTCLYSFRLGVVGVNNIYSANISSNNFARRYEETVLPTGINDVIPFVVGVTGNMQHFLLHDNIIRNLSGIPVSCAGTPSHVSIKNNILPNCWTFFEPTSNIGYIFLALVNCPFLQIEGNMFDSTVTSRIYRIFDSSVQTDKNTFVGANPAPWNWADSRLSYLPTILVAGVPASVAPTGRSGRYFYDGKFVHFDIMLVSGFTETSGAVEITLPPIAAIAENPDITGSYGGYGIVTSHSGWISAGNSFSRCVVNPATQRLQLFKEGGMVRGAVGAADKSGAVTLYISGKYRA